MNFYDFPILGKIALKIIVKAQKGCIYSKTMRKYVLKKYNVYVGRYSYGACFNDNFNTGGKSVIIGNYCSFSNNVRYFGTNHPMQHASMSPLFYNSKTTRYNVNDIERHTLTIGNDVWIGEGTIITKSCHKIGNGCIIGSGSIVTKDVEPYTIVAGNPAKVIKRRFDKETIELLEESKWWEMSIDELMPFYSFIEQPSEFARKIIEKRSVKND